MEVPETVREVFRFEELKLILPLFVTVMLLLSVFALHYDQSRGYSEQAAAEVRGEMTNLTAGVLGAEVYGEALVTDQVYPVDPELAVMQQVENNPVMLYLFPVLDTVQDIPFIVLVPGREEGILFGKTEEQTISTHISRDEEMFSQGEGYMLPHDEHIRRELVLILSRGQMISEFWFEKRDWAYSQNASDDRAAAELIRENMSLEEYQTFITNDVRNHVPPEADPTHDAYPWKTVQWYHFLPAFVTNFALYYLLNGLLVVGARRLKDTASEYIPPTDT